MSIFVTISDNFYYSFSKETQINNHARLYLLYTDVNKYSTRWIKTSGNELFDVWTYGWSESNPKCLLTGEVMSWIDWCVQCFGLFRVWRPFRFIQKIRQIPTKKSIIHWKAIENPELNNGWASMSKRFTFRKSCSPATSRVLSLWSFYLLSNMSATLPQSTKWLLGAANCSEDFRRLGSKVWFNSIHMCPGAICQLRLLNWYRYKLYGKLFFSWI